VERVQKVSVGGFLLREGKTLILRRSDREELFAGYFEIPGGKVEFGDDPARTAEREFSEETGLTATARKPYFILSYVLENTQRIEIVFLMESDDRSSVHLSDEHVDYRWVSRDDLETGISSGTIRMTEEMQGIIKAGFCEHLEEL
jgi:8-oxo-dGTP diphosphatase